MMMMNVGYTRLSPPNNEASTLDKIFTTNGSGPKQIV